MKKRVPARAPLERGELDSWRETQWLPVLGLNTHRWPRQRRPIMRSGGRSACSVLNVLPPSWLPVRLTSSAPPLWLPPHICFTIRVITAAYNPNFSWTRTESRHIGAPFLPIQGVKTTKLRSGGIINPTFWSRTCGSVNITSSKSQKPPSTSSDKIGT